MERVLDVYRRPYNADIPLVCMDETPRQLIRETRTPIPARPGQLERQDYEYERCGVCTCSWRANRWPERGDPGDGTQD